MFRQLKRAFAALAIVAAACLLQAGSGGSPALAADAGNCTSGGGGGATGGGGAAGTQIEIWLNVAVEQGTVCPGGAANNTQPTWNPPPCWWAPVFQPADMKQFAYANVGDAGAAGVLWAAMLDYYETDNGKTAEPAGYQSTDGPDYWQWNIDMPPSGMWWGMVVNQALVGTPAEANCILSSYLNSDGMPWSWAPNGPPANIPGPAISDQLMAEYAAEVMELPTTTFTSSPAYGTNLTVNLPTWLWMDGANYKQQSLTLCWEPTGTYCVTVVANPTSFTVNTTAPSGDYNLFTSGCVADGGTIGTPYQPSDGNADPPCGITFTHSTAGASGQFGISVTVNWAITWAGDGAGFTVQDPITSTEQYYNVQEIENMGGD